MEREFERLYVELDTNENYKRQWVKEVINYSSQYSSSWGAKHIINKPTVYPRYGDITGSWAQAQCDANQFIELKYAVAVYPAHINIYETYHCGGVIRIKVKNMEANEWVTVWENLNGPENISTSRIFSPSLSTVLFKTQEVRLEVDCTLARSWCEIDSVELIGKNLLVEKVDTETTLSDNLLTLLKSQEFSDLDLEVEGKILKGHRNIFASRSTFFKNLLTESLLDEDGHNSSKPVHIENISYNAFKSLMFYLYTGRIEADTNGETVCELIRASEWYELEDLDSVGYLYVKENLCLENVLPILVCATEKMPQLDRVEKACLKYLAKNFNIILNNPEFKTLNRETVLKIAQFYGQFFQNK